MLGCQPHGERSSHASEDSSGHLNSRERPDQACSLLVRPSRGPTSHRDRRCVSPEAAQAASWPGRPSAQQTALLCGKKPRLRDQRAAEPGRAAAAFFLGHYSLTFSC